MSWLSKLTGRDRARESLQNFQQLPQVKAAQASAADPGGLNKRYADALDSTGKGGWTEDPNAWKEAFNTTAGATINNALPQLRQGLQMTREDAIRRGVSGGDYGTSAEGDLTSAWQRNLSNALAGQAENAYSGYQGRSMASYENNQNRYLDLLTGGMDRNTADQNAKKKGKSGLWGGIGAVGGFLLSGGNPAGAAAGQAIGSGIGGYF